MCVGVCKQIWVLPSPVREARRGNGQLNQACDVTVDASSGNIIVAHTNNNSVQVFGGVDGSFVCKFRQPMIDNSHLHYQYSVAVDGSGNRPTKASQCPGEDGHQDGAGGASFGASSEHPGVRSKEAAREGARAPTERKGSLDRSETRAIRRETQPRRSWRAFAAKASTPCLRKSSSSSSLISSLRMRKACGGWKRSLSAVCR